MYLNPLFARIPFLSLVLLSEDDKAPFQTSVYLHTSTCLSSGQMFYLSLHLLKQLWWYQSNVETPISSIILYLNPFSVRIIFLGLFLSSEDDKTPFLTSVHLHTNTCLSAELRVYISPSVEGVLVVSIYHIDTYIILQVFIFVAY